MKILLIAYQIEKSNPINLIIWWYLTKLTCMCKKYVLMNNKRKSKYVNVIRSMFPKIVLILQESSCYSSIKYSANSFGQCGWCSSSWSDIDLVPLQLCWLDYRGNYSILFWIVIQNTSLTVVFPYIIFVCMIYMSLKGELYRWSSINSSQSFGVHLQETTNQDSKEGCQRYELMYCLSSPLCL